MSGQPNWLAIAMLVAFFALLMARRAGGAHARDHAASSSASSASAPGLFNLLPARIYGVVANYQWLAIPLFVFMGVMLEKSRLADDLLDVVGHLAGGLRGGMALGIIGVGVLMGATTGIVGATVITLGLLTLPTLLQRGYDPGIACGAICASGTLGPDHPAEPDPDPARRTSCSSRSARSSPRPCMPGLLLAALYCVYIVIFGMVRPDRDAADPARGARRALPRARALVSRSSRSSLPPVALVLAVLGSIIGGVAAPTEAASMGALGSILVTTVAGRMSLQGPDATRCARPPRSPP